MQSKTHNWNDPWDCTRAPFPNKYQYRDGSLVKVPTAYLKSTKSSRAKLCPKIPRQSIQSEGTPDETQGEGCPRPWWQEGECTPDPHDDLCMTYERDKFRKPWSLWWIHRVDIYPLKLSDTGYRDFMDRIALLPATRLEDDELQKTSLKHSFIDDGHQARLLIQGRELAQQCLWKFVEKRIPGQNPWKGWQQVRFEWGLLSSSWGAGGKYHGLLRFRASQPDLVWMTIQDLITLRHTTSHYSESSSLFPCRLDDVDKHLKNVQKLAIQLYDKQGALEARRLRDELRQAAHNTFAEIMALGTLATLPFAGYPWKDYHEDVLMRLAIDLENAHEGRRKIDEHFPEVIGRIAEDWSWQYWGAQTAYEPPVRLGVCPRTTPKRRHSTSVRKDSGIVTDLTTRIKANWKWQQRHGCDAIHEVPEWLLDEHGQVLLETRPRAERRMTWSSQNPSIME